MVEHGPFPIAGSEAVKVAGDRLLVAPGSSTKFSQVGM